MHVHRSMGATTHACTCEHRHPQAVCQRRCIQRTCEAVQRHAKRAQLLARSSAQPRDLRAGARVLCVPLLRGHGHPASTQWTDGTRPSVICLLLYAQTAPTPGTTRPPHPIKRNHRCPTAHGVLSAPTCIICTISCAIALQPSQSVTHASPSTRKPAWKPDGHNHAASQDALAMPI